MDKKFLPVYSGVVLFTTIQYMVDREKKPARTVTSLKWISEPNALRLPPSMPQRAVVVHYRGTYYLQAPEVRRIPIEGLAGGGIESKHPPCESTSLPAQNSEKTQRIIMAN